MGHAGIWYPATETVDILAAAEEFARNLGGISIPNCHDRVAHFLLRQPNRCELCLASLAERVDSAESGGSTVAIRRRCFQSTNFIL